MRLKTLMLGAAASVALAPSAFAERGSDGQVNIIYWQAPSTLNPYLSSGTKDLEASSLVIEPLAGFDEKGVVFPRLAAEIPSVENGGISQDLKSVTWKLKPGLKWSDGTPLTSEDVKFTADYCMNPEGGCAQLARYEGIDSIETPDPLTVVIHFREPRPNPFTAFTGAQSPVLQKAQFGKCVGSGASACTAENFGPIGTGPFRVVEFRTNDSVTLEANPNYRDPEKPAFAKAVLKGGGDAAAAARAVLETGEFDYAWNTLVPPDALKGMAAAGKGKIVTGFGTLVERIEMNLTDPSPDLPEGERATARHPHPILSDERVRRALSMAIDRTLLTEIGFGDAGRPTCNLVPAPETFASDNTGCLEQDIEGAKKLLDEAGWAPGADGIRQKDGKPLELLFQSSVNPIRQDFQALIKQWWQEIGVATELKSVDPSVFFGGDAGSPDTFQRFYADVEMYANNFDGTDPEPYLARYTCEKAPGPESQWQGENVNRYCDPEYDRLIVELGKTADIGQRADLAKRLNDMITKDSMTIVPLVDRGRVSAHSNRLGGVILNTWDSELWNVADWTRVK
ncbi:peptide ABC transporter substrate-binding protein [Paracoccus sp. CPCC 101403]|uniref:Peptide ABC transporter substrate-binding protein n=1 Tax=Paracoccus broussonetiae TaxID=3075834 RepID=A0ABU3EH67_9RHOB|nr:peptide ABC transporter substrate-binding protein [Paracoccus sp. CPCC 101403]MDT1063441.1 peptide ABC transporter substrate-binding protein [Paracoccus sp. CPCC 101403]